ncbi:hypothetical protein NKR23_g9504 [Pleurostoma richardsiae]|uniref:Indole-diterpene biosynthesis protein PaxU n=1 Tax=Pleurostoma richardsiae TaxID=41990 RepID=A0AA38VMV6_9PEZI|nr:hypothetical protein NKR23_g9504 [Pleurostoma richardsiae]
MATKRDAPGLPGFKPLSKEVFLFDPASGKGKAISSHSHPDPSAILLFGWGDAHPKHLVKFTDGYRKLFPSSRVVLVRSSMIEVIFQNVHQRSRAMPPVIDAALGAEGAVNDGSKGGILIHIMSNTGYFSFISMLARYRDRYKTTFPTALLVCDSTPGSCDFGSQAHRIGTALARITGTWLPLPFRVLLAFWLSAVWVVEGIKRLTGGGNDLMVMLQHFMDPNFATLAAPRLFLYSKGDDLVWWEDVEENIALARRKGYRCVAEVFEDTPHVGHMKGYPERYWGAIERAWEGTLSAN